MKSSKKGFIRTLEAVIAIFITFFFISFVLPTRPAVPTLSENLNILDTLKEDETLRDCVIIGNATCINNTIRINLENRFEFVFNISSDPTVRVRINDAPSQVYAESILISGNSTSYNPRILRLYYWARPPQ